MYQASQLNNFRDFASEFDSANSRPNAILQPADAWEEFTDYALPRLPAPRTVQPATVQRRLRQALRGQPLAVGEIVPARQAERGLGQLVSRKELGYRRGQRALVTYDNRGNVYMRVYTPSMNPTSGWFQVGAVTTRGLPTDPSRRGVAIEPRIRRLVGRATGTVFRPKHGSATGPDLVPSTTRPRRRSRLGVGRSRFDDFDHETLESVIDQPNVLNPFLEDWLEEDFDAGKRGRRRSRNLTAQQRRTIRNLAIQAARSLAHRNRRGGSRRPIHEQGIARKANNIENRALRMIDSANSYEQVIVWMRRNYS